MSRLVAAALCLAMLGAAAADARTPAPPERHEYYGPIRICGEIARGEANFAFDVHDSEAYIVEGDPDWRLTHLVLSGGGYLKIGDPSPYDEEPMRQFVRPRGDVEVPGKGLRRLQTVSPAGATGAFLYVYTTEHKGHPFKSTIESSFFDGSGRDRSVLERIAFDDRAREMCAAVPDHLRAGPERERPEAFWLSPERHKGPLTVCTAGLAFDVGPGEAALLPWRWRQMWGFFRVVAGDGHTDIGGLEERVWRRGGEPDVKGPVALDPRFRRRSAGRSPSWVPNRILTSGPDSPLVLLSRRADAQPDPPDGKEPVSFTFDRPSTEADRQAFVERLRTQLPGDRCLGAGRP